MKELRIDFQYDINDDLPLALLHRDSVFLIRRSAKTTVDAATGGAGATLADIGSGTGEILRLAAQRGWFAVGLEPSVRMLRAARGNLGREVELVQGIGEGIPFRDGSIDRIVCQFSLDHFATPQAFAAEVARALRPGGRAVFALGNYDSLSCRLSRLIYEVRRSLRMPIPAGRPYWQIPPNHTFRGSYNVARRLGGRWMELEDCYGVSLLWLFPRWSRLVDRLPAALAWSTLEVMNRIARRLPMLADAIVCIWRPVPT